MDVSIPTERARIEDLAGRIATLTAIDRDPASLKKYQRSLFHVLLKNPYFRYRQSFEVPKANGSRFIRPAGSHLQYVHKQLANWLLSIPGAMGEDYSYILRKGAPATAAMHKDMFYAAVYDLKNAFDYVKQDSIEHWLLYYYPLLSQHEAGQELIRNISDLMCFHGHTPQGCTITPYAYNLIIKPLDQMLRLYCQKRWLLYTRYSDNICISSVKKIDFQNLDRYVSQVVRSVGFRLNPNKTEYASRQPIRYLGALIYDGAIVPDIERQESILLFMDNVLSSDERHKFRRQVNGRWTHVYLYCLGVVPVRLWQPFYMYYQSVGKPPRTFELAKVTDRDITPLWRPE